MEEDSLDEEEDEDSEAAGFAGDSDAAAGLLSLVDALPESAGLLSVEPPAVFGA